MSKKNFITLILGVVGGLFFALGMCMALLPEWNVFVPGVVFGVIGGVILLAMWLIRRKMSGKAPIRFSVKTVFPVVFGVIGALVFGTGMCMVMVWNMIIGGIFVGLFGIVLLLCLIPLTVGLR
ncbi:MAG: hypothetical protein IJC82_05500 [Firmicutes bacterium]|nr:hypothetical protein [Bacillota bacterium]